jgi:hypothetical protein
VNVALGLEEVENTCTKRKTNARKEGGKKEENRVQRDR